MCRLRSRPTEPIRVEIVGGVAGGSDPAVNAASEALRTVFVEGFAPGGQAGTSTRIENYP